jgi:hypothetical protein
MRHLTCVLFWLAISASFGQPRTEQSGSPQAPRTGNDETWKALDSLVGTWAGEGTGEPGQGSGAFSFSWDLQQKVLVRKSHADYPTTKDHPAFSHQDLILVYQEPDTRQPKAVYFDNEGHVINYVVTVSPDANSIVFLSELKPSTPRYRLTYIMTSKDRVEMAFEIAPADKPDSFKTYIKAGARRQ